MGTRKTIAGTITVSTIEDGESYSIESTLPNIVIPSDASSTTASGTFTFYRKVGTGSKEAYPCFWAVFAYNGSTYTRMQRGGTTKTSTATITNKTISTTYKSLVVCIYDTYANSSAHSGYLVELIIPVGKNGNTGADGKYTVSAFARSKSRTLYSDAYIDTTIGTSGWATTAPSPTTTYPYIWERRRTYDPNTGLYSNTTYICLTGDTPELYQIYIDSASAKVGANGKMNASIVVYVYKIVGTTRTIHNTGTMDYTAGTQTGTAETHDTAFTLTLSDVTYSSIGSPSEIKFTYKVDSQVTATVAVPITVVGQMGRNIYFAGILSDLVGTTFAATDYSAPYVKEVKNGSTHYWLYVGANGTITYPSTCANNNDWDEMNAEFKYLITQAIFSYFAKLGSAIFNGDYMFSQHGVKLGAASTAYEGFRPDVLEGDARIVTAEKSITGTTSVTLGQVYVEAGSAYKFEVVFSSVSASTTFTLDGTGYNWSGTLGTTTKTFERSATNWTGNSGTITIRAKLSNSATVKIASVIVYRLGFNPNVSIDWMKGIVRANTGWFKNVTIEGVLNNMETVITESSASEHGYYFQTDGLYFLDPLTVGNVLKVSDGYTTIVLPVAWGDATTHETNIESGKAGHTQVPHTITEMRQMVGKRIWVYAIGNNALQFCAGTSQTINIAHRYGAWVGQSRSFAEGDMEATSSTTYNVQQQVTLDAQYPISTGGVKVCLIECKEGSFQGRECIYWEVEALYNPLT